MLTVADTVTVTDNGVRIIGYTDLPSRLPTQSSQLYATNLINMLKLLCKEKQGDIVVDFDDVVIRGVTVIRDGELTCPAPPITLSAQPKPAQAAPAAKPVEPPRPASPLRKYALIALAIILFGWLADAATRDFLLHFTVFALACVVGALLQIGDGGWVSFLSFIAVLIASINIFGGFTVTQRMLKMFLKN